MGKFKAGDIVVRTAGEWCGHKAGQTGLVHDCGECSLRLTGHGDVTYDPKMYELVVDKPADKPTGRKDDSGKLDMTLLDDMPRATKALVEVMQWAITQKKPVPYDRGSWLGVAADRYRAAVQRHNRDAAEQALGSTHPVRFQRDQETNLLHLAHIACSAMMALENTLRELENTDGRS